MHRDQLSLGRLVGFLLGGIPSTRPTGGEIGDVKDLGLVTDGALMDGVSHNGVVGLQRSDSLRGHDGLGQAGFANGMQPALIYNLRFVEVMAGVRRFG
jgi:hypothetical protein